MIISFFLLLLFKIHWNSRYICQIDVVFPLKECDQWWFRLHIKKNQKPLLFSQMYYSNNRIIDQSSINLKKNFQKWYLKPKSLSLHFVSFFFWDPFSFCVQVRQIVIVCMYQWMCCCFPTIKKVHRSFFSFCCNLTLELR